MDPYILDCLIIYAGKGLTKDRLMQACMRMLGKRHRVMFFASHKVNIYFETQGLNIEVKEVL